MAGPGAGEAVVERMDASPLLLVGAMVMLAALDFLGAVLAKEWAEGRNHWLFAAGLVAFGAPFAVYAVSLKVAELSTVTFGWIVTLQVGLLLLERIRYAVELPNGKWAAIVAILVLQAYLILAPNGSSRDGHRGPGRRPRAAPGGAAEHQRPRGQRAERLLRERFAIAPEGSDLRGVVCMVTIGDTPASVDQLVGAFTAPAAQHPPHPAPRCRRPCGAPARSPSRQCRRAQVHICGPDDPTLDRVAVVDGV